MTLASTSTCWTINTSKMTCRYYMIVRYTPHLQGYPSRKRKDHMSPNCSSNVTFAVLCPSQSCSRTTNSIPKSCETYYILRGCHLNIVLKWSNDHNQEVPSRIETLITKSSILELQMTHTTTNATASSSFPSLDSKTSKG